MPENPPDHGCRLDERDDAVKATADTLQATLECMQVVEEMRRTLRDIRDVSKGDAN